MSRKIISPCYGNPLREFCFGQSDFWIASKAASGVAQKVDCKLIILGLTAGAEGGCACEQQKLEYLALSFDFEITALQGEFSAAFTSYERWMHSSATEDFECSWW